MTNNRGTIDDVLNQIDSNSQRRGGQTKHTINKSAMVAGKETVKVTKKALEDLKKRAASLANMEKEKAKAEKAAKTIRNNAEKIATEYKSVNEENQNLLAQLEKLKAQVEAAPAKNAETVSPSPSPTDLRKLPTNKKVKKEDLNAELVNHVMHTSKTSLFRTCKFIEDVEEEKDVTREIIPLLPVKLEIPEDEFVEKYKGIVYDGIKAGRTDVQSNGKKRAQELFDLIVKELGSEGEVLPTCDEILELLKYSVDHFENPENALDKKKLLWYQDRWLPIAIGLEYWDDKNRHYDLPTDTQKMRDGVDRLLCTATSEAFGLMVYDNCRDKWEAIMKLKAENKGIKIPRSGPHAAKYEAKWTLTKEGQKKYGGWANEAYERFNSLIQIVQDLRKNDEENDKVFQKYCRKIMRELHNIPEDQLAWNGPVQRKKVTAPPTPIDPSKRKKIRVKE